MVVGRSKTLRGLGGKKKWRSGISPRDYFEKKKDAN